MSAFVGLSSVRFADRRVLITPYLSEGFHRTAISDKGNVDPGSTPPTLLRPGNVLAYSAAAGRFVTTAQGGDPSAPATVVALANADATWPGKTIDVYKDGGLVVSVPLAPNDNADPAVAAELNNSPVFRANFVASVGARLTIKALEPGVGTVVKANIQGLPAAFGPNGTEARGTDGDYVVTLEYMTQLNPIGVLVDVKVHAVSRGHFDDANLIGLTQDAKSVLLRRGSRFGR